MMTSGALSSDIFTAGAAELDLAKVLADFAEHGFARLGRALEREDLDALRRRADELMLGRVVHPGLFFQHDTTTGRYDDLEYGRGYVGPSLNYRKLEKLERDPLYLAWIHNPLFERIARARIEGPIAIYRACLFNKAASGGTPLPWHQDGGKLWGLDRDPELQIWTALDDAPIESGCLEVVPGSHREGIATPLGGLIPEPIVRARHADERRMFVPAHAGDVILVHNHLWHRSAANRTGKARRAFTVCYMSARTRCVRKRKTPRNFVEIFDARGESSPGLLDSPRRSG